MSNEHISLCSLPKSVAQICRLSEDVGYLELVALLLQQRLVDGHWLQLVNAGLHLRQPLEHVLLQLLVGAEGVGAGPALPQTVIQQLLQLRPLALQLLGNPGGELADSRAPAAPITGSPAPGEPIIIIGVFRSGQLRGQFSTIAPFISDIRHIYNSGIPCQTTFTEAPVVGRSA